MIIIGVDPGKMTGWATYGVDTALEFQSEQGTAEEFVDRIVPYLEKTSIDILLAVERFTISGGTVRKGRTDENWSIEQIGILRHWARRFGHRFELQSVGDAKKFCSDGRLKEIGWFTPGRGHANDAARHVLLCVARHREDVLERLLTTS